MNWEQLKTILWLRWRLTRNQWTRSRGVGAVITGLVAVAMIVLAGLSFGGGLLGGMFGLKDAKPMLIMGVWFGVTVAFLFLWFIGLINEIQRSETIDLQRLMHLPVVLGQLFVINYFASLLTMGIFLFVPGMAGLSIGLAISRNAAMLWLLPLALSMVFMITAWTYFLRGWLASLMSNPRRRRAVIVGITFVFVMLSQAPNLYFNLLARNDRHSATHNQSSNQPPKSAQQQKLQQWIAMQKFIPPLWVPVGAGALAEGRVWPALLGAAGGFALGALGLRRAYVSTVRFYHGQSSKQLLTEPATKPLEPAVRPAGAAARAAFVEAKLPVVPEEACALALATFRSMLRAPEVKMAWGSSFLVTLILAASFMLRNPPKMPEEVKPFLATGGVVFSIFMLVQFFANQFGFDRDGFRALVLSPAPRRYILLGKNLACAPVGLAFGLLVLLLIAVWAHLGLLAILAAMFQLATLLLLAGSIGNLLSILAPYRIQPGSMKPTKMPGMAMLLMVVCHLFFPLAMFPVFLPPLAGLVWSQAGWPAAVPVNLLLSALLAAAAALFYWQMFEPFGRLLQRRETQILAVVTVEVE